MSETIKLSGVDMDRLNAVVDAMNTQGFMYASKREMQKLATAGFVESNDEMTNPENVKEVAFRATQAGIDAAAGDVDVDDAGDVSVVTARAKRVDPSSVEVITDNIDFPEVKRGRGRGRTSSYKFGDLTEVGHSFFVPGGTKKAISTVVSTNNKKMAPKKFRYAEYERNGVAGVLVQRIA